MQSPQISVHQAGREVEVFLLGGETNVVHPVQHDRVRADHFLPRQHGSGTKMGSSSKGQMRSGILAANIKSLHLVELFFIPIS